MVDRSGQQLGNYHVLRLIGRGGFADVYLGEHIYLKTQVAIKLLQSKVGNEEDLESFLKEARTIAHLVHPNIVRVMDFGVDGEIPFLVMDYAPNGTLRQQHPKGTLLQLTTIIPYIKQVAAALQHAHNEKLIHRDVKPENMLLGRNHDVLLSDFGIALIAQSSRYQSTQEVIGTVAYMSPEQIQGKPRPASDQYSLGIVVYEWLSGDRPFHGSFTELCAQHMFASPPPLHEKVPTISPDVEQVVTTALAKDPHQRFGSVQAFATALEQASYGQRSTFSPTQPASPLSQPPPAIIQKPVTPPPLPPAQAAPISSFPPTQYAGGSSPQEMKFSSSASIPAEMKPVTEPSGGKIGTVERKSERVSVWRIGKRQIMAALIGFAITACLSTPTPFALNGSYASPPIIALILLGLVPVMSEFFGAAFGPWVGLFTGVGPLVVYGIASSASYGFSHYDVPWGIYWPIQLGLMLIGFVSGFATLKKKGRYNIGRTLGFSSLGVVVGTAFAIPFVSTQDPYYVISEVLTPGIIFAIVYVIVGLILLPIALVTYINIANRIKPTPNL